MTKQGTKGTTITLENVQKLAAEPNAVNFAHLTCTINGVECYIQVAKLGFQLADAGRVTRDLRTGQNRTKSTNTMSMNGRVQFSFQWRDSIITGMHYLGTRQVATSVDLSPEPNALDGIL